MGSVTLMLRKKPAHSEGQETQRPARSRASLFDGVLRTIAAASTFLHRDVTSFCDLATCDQRGLITFQGDYATVIRLRGMRRIANGAEIAAASSRLRLALGSQFSRPGHALQFCYVADPEGVSESIRRNLDERRTVAGALNADFEDIFTERQKVLPPFMRQERTYLILWTRPACLSSQEVSQAKRERASNLKGLPPLGDAQNPLLGSLELGTIHQTFVQGTCDALSAEAVQVDILSPEEGLQAIRHELYPDTIGSAWTPSTPLRNPGGTVPETDAPADAADVLWPPLREQLFRDDASTPDFSTARMGVFDWSPIELTRVPEMPVPGVSNKPVPTFTELAGRLSGRRMPWRATALIEGVRPGYMLWKDTIAQFLKFGSNTPINSGFEELKAMRSSQSDSIVKLRMAFATRSSAGDTEALRTRASRLEQAIQSWDSAQASRVCGDPLAGVLSSVPGLALASTAPPTPGPMSQILTMMPWARPGMPWSDGAMLFRANDGTVVPYDPAGSGREAVLDLFVAPSRRGKSMLANALLLATVLSPAAMTSHGARLPLIGKMDVGDSSSGFIDMVRAGLRQEERHLALHIPFQLIDEHAYNIFDTETCCRTPLPYHRTFLTNFLAQICKPLDGSDFESMNQLIDALITAAYEYYSDTGPSVRPKMYREGVDRLGIDMALAHHRLSATRATSWWEVADMLANVGDMRMAHRATQFAVPVISDLVEVVREERIRLEFEKANPTGGAESSIDVFRRYLNHFVAKFPSLTKPTRLDLGDARIVVIDIDRVAPEGQGEAQRQTDLMYLLGFQIVSRNFFLHPDDAQYVPLHVRPYHRKRFEEFRESFKRIECDEFQRTAGAPFIQKQFEEAARRGAKLNVKIGLASQKLADFGDYLISHSTGRFILGAGDEEEANEICQRFRLSSAAQAIVRNGLNGPRADGSGAPLIWQTRVNHELYELFVLNLMGPIELWALSTSPKDTALRRRLYDALGTTEARRRLAKVFPKGSAEQEIERREDVRMKAGQDASTALGGVIEDIARELKDGVGLGTVIRMSSEDEVSALTKESATLSA
ncbi:type IV secretion protein DotO [Gluconobacter oxydans]|nr:type IV secretion protein DotO [Gluconobacter oxydans]